jgi:hypothetical protein
LFGLAGLVLTAGGSPSPTRYQAVTTVLANGRHGPELCLSGILTSDPPQCGGTPIANWDWSAAPSKHERGGVTWTDAVRVVGTYDGTRFTLTQPPRAAAPGEGAGPEPDDAPGCAHPQPATGPSLALGIDTSGHEADMVAEWPSDPAVSKTWHGPPFTLTMVVRPGKTAVIQALVRGVYQGPLCMVERDAPSWADLDRAERELTARAKAFGLLGVGVVPRLGQVEARVVVATPALQDEVDRRWPGMVRLDPQLTPVAS